jgi:predicted regulator of Ras-like GTPase activity (Roadblock/LC7/MglB family)
MGWLSGIFSSREISRLEELLETSPAPSVYLRLSEALLKKGREHEAKLVLAKGSSAFPDNSKLRGALTDLNKKNSISEIKRLKDNISKFPNPTTYAKLAKILLGVGDITECKKVCEESLRNFPKYSGTHYILALIERQEDNQKNVIRELKLAIKIDSNNYQATMMLAEELAKEGRIDEAVHYLEGIFKFAPDDQKTTAFIKKLQSQKDPPTARTAKSQKISADTAEIDIPQVQAETMQKAGKKISISSTISTNVNVFKKAFDELAFLEGVRCCILLDTSGLLIESSVTDKDTEESNAALAASITSCTEDMTNMLNLGDFEEGAIENDEGTIFIHRLDNMILSIFTDPTAKTGLLHRAVERFINKFKTY